MRALLFITTLAITALAYPAAQKIDQDASYQVAGLSKPAEIIVDKWGVPHIYANDHYDVFFVQGFNAARDRLWQIDTWRRRGLGTLSEVLGPAYVDQDKVIKVRVVISVVEMSTIGALHPLRRPTRLGYLRLQQRSFSSVGS